jgi:hypothetical protein
LLPRKPIATGIDDDSLRHRWRLFEQDRDFGNRIGGFLRPTTVKV